MDKKTKKVTAHNKKVLESEGFLDFLVSNLVESQIKLMNENVFYKKEMNFYKKFAYINATLLLIGLIVVNFL